MAYVSDAAATLPSNAYLYLDTGDMQPVELSAENVTAVNNKGFIFGWNMFSASREIQLFGRLYSDVYNEPLYLLPSVRLHFKYTESRPSSYLMKKSVDSKTVFKFQDVKLLVRCVKPNPVVLLAVNVILKKMGSLARYKLTRVELKTFAFAASSKSLSIENAVLDPIPKLLLFTMVKNRF